MTAAKETDAAVIMTDAPGDRAEAVIRDGLGAYNFEQAGYRDHRPLAVLVCDPDTKPGRPISAPMSRAAFLEAFGS